MYLYSEIDSLLMREMGETKIITILTICIMLVSVGLSGCVDDDEKDKKNHSLELIIEYPTSNYGFDFYENDVFIIRWSASDIDNDKISINLYFSKDNKTWNNISVDEENDGEYHWKINSEKLLDTGQFFGTFYLKIIASDGKDKNIKIVHAPISFAMPNGHHDYLEIFSPNGGENWSGIQNITWSTNFTGDEKIKISLIENFNNRSYIITDFIYLIQIAYSNNDSLFMYEIDTTKYKNGDKYLIHIEIENETDDISDGFFSIYN